MRLEGRIWQDGDHWLIEVDALGAMTQGYSQDEARDMIKDLIEMMADSPGFEITVEPRDAESFEIEANDAGVLVALLLRRQREKRGLTLAQAASLLKQSSRNAYARYEQGKSMPTVDKLEELLRAIAPEQKLVWRFAA